MNNDDFFDKDSFYNHFEANQQQTQPQPQGPFFPKQPQLPLMNFPQQQFMGNFMNMPPPSGMYYPPFPNQYMHYVCSNIYYVDDLGL